ncbi:MAG: enoyl-ACP reductase [Desulfovibrionaceae bacterium]|nr:enoyl-ACP reductase [Desulfovibrionaceae bacterium]
MMLENKKCLILGVANQKSIAYGIASAFRREGARLAFSYLGEAIKKRVEPISEELGGEFIFPCDVSSDESIAQAVQTVREQWGTVDVIVHSVAFAPKEALSQPFIETTREAFRVALDVSAYSLPAVCNAFLPIMNPGASVLTMTYYGAQKVIPNYNVMGVAKAALEASVRYLSADLGLKGMRINAISAGAVRTLAASGISDFRHLFKQFEDVAALHRNITIEEIGNAAAFLCSDMASAITGETVFVDCGCHNMAL